MLIEMEQSDINVDITVCILCRKLLENPKTLPCMDTFCLKCLEDIERSGRWAFDSFCPNCHISFTMPAAGLQSLPTCDFLLRKIHGQIIKNLGDGNAPCDICLPGVSEAADVPSAVVFCITCHQKLCDRCWQCHKAFPATKCHNTVILGAGTSHQMLNSRDDSEIQCFNHHRIPAELHCFRCSQSLCSACLILHLGHEIQTIDDATQNYRYEVGTGIDRLNERVKHYGDCHAQFAHSDYLLNKLKAEIVENAEGAKRLIDEHTNRLNDELDYLRNENNAKKVAFNSSSAALTLKTVEFAKELVSDGSIRDLLSFSKSTVDLMHRQLQCDVIDLPAATLFNFIPSCFNNMARDVNIVGSIAPISPKSSPSLRFVIPSFRRDDAVVGLTSINDSLYVLRSPCNNEIEVYNIQFGKKQKTLQVKELRGYGPHGLTSCVANNCLYVSDSKTDTVYKIELSSDTRVIYWKVAKWPEELSVNDACNVLVACYEARRIQEFKTNGDLVRQISLLDAEFSPFQAVQLDGGRLVVSGCLGKWPSTNYDVVEVDSNGRIVTSYKNTLTSTTRHKFKNPSQLAVDRNQEYILVADSDNNRIVTLNRSKKVPAREFNAPSVEGGLVKPWSICYDEAHNRLHVGEANWRNYSRVFVFDNVINIANNLL